MTREINIICSVVTLFSFRNLSRIVPILPPANKVWGKVMFLHLCVILFTGVEGLASQHASQVTWPRDVYLQGEGSASRGVCLQGGLHPGGVGQIPPDTWIRDIVNKQAVHILLEGILVFCWNVHFTFKKIQTFTYKMFLHISSFSSLTGKQLYNYEILSTYEKARSTGH